MSVVRYFYASGMRIPTSRALVELADGTVRRVIVAAEGATRLDDAAESAFDGTHGTITVNDLVSESVDTVLITADDGLFSLPFDATRATGAQRELSSEAALEAVFLSLPLSKRTALAQMQLEMLPRSQRSRTHESRARLIASLPHLSKGALASVVAHNDAALCFVDDEVLEMMLDHDMDSVVEITRWAMELLAHAPHVDRFVTRVIASSCIPDEIRQEVSTRYVSRLERRFESAHEEIEMLCAAARAEVPGVTTILKRVLRNQSDEVAARYEMRMRRVAELDEMAFVADAPAARAMLEHVGDLLGHEAFFALVEAAPTAALRECADRVTAEMIDGLDVPAAVLVQTRPDLLDAAARDWLVEHPGSITREFAIDMSDAEVDRASATPELVRAIVDNGAAATVLVNRLLKERRDMALAYVVEDLEECAFDVSVGAVLERPAESFFDAVASREELRLMEDALATIPARSRMSLIDDLAARDRYAMLRVAAQLTARQIAEAVEDATRRLARDPYNRVVRRALQSFLARREQLLASADEHTSVAIELGASNAEDLLAGKITRISIDASALGPASRWSINAADAVEYAEELTPQEYELVRKLTARPIHGAEGADQEWPELITDVFEPRQLRTTASLDQNPRHTPAPTPSQASRREFESRFFDAYEQEMATPGSPGVPGGGHWPAPSTPRHEDFEFAEPTWADDLPDREEPGIMTLPDEELDRLYLAASSIEFQDEHEWEHHTAPRASGATGLHVADTTDHNAADLDDADLCEADLGDADLGDADLGDAQDAAEATFVAYADALDVLSFEPPAPTAAPQRDIPAPLPAAPLRDRDEAAPPAVTPVIGVAPAPTVTVIPSGDHDALRDIKLSIEVKLVPPVPETPTAATTSEVPQAPSASSLAAAPRDDVSSPAVDERAVSAAEMPSLEALYAAALAAVARGELTLPGSATPPVDHSPAITVFDDASAEAITDPVLTEPVIIEPVITEPKVFEPAPLLEAPAPGPSLQAALAADREYVSPAHRQAAMELARLKDEEAVFSVMITSTKQPREARWARKQLKDTEQKLERMERIVAKFEK